MLFFFFLNATRSVLQTHTLLRDTVLELVCNLDLHDVKLLPLGAAPGMGGDWHVLLPQHLITGSGEGESSGYPGYPAPAHPGDAASHGEERGSLGR